MAYRDAVITFVVLALVWNFLRHRKIPPPYSVMAGGNKPLPLRLGLVDHVKALISWVFLFMRVFWVRPGLYQIGSGGGQSPILVTSNNFLTVFLLAKSIAGRPVRLLVLDTDGINVWCAASKGKFSAREIIDKAGSSGLVADGAGVKIILPKLCLSGVNLAELRRSGFVPVIGPLSADQLPGYLDRAEFENRDEDRVEFGLKARVFTALPTAVQFFLYFLGVYVLSLGTISQVFVWIATGIAFIYPVLFPWLPGTEFATKGISLGLLAALAAAGLLMAGILAPATALVMVLFIVATSVFVGLSYTGNSPISNYSRVRKEIARYLPVVVLLYLLAVAAHLALGGCRD